MIPYLIAQLVLIIFNLLNAWHDAERIRLQKRIYHGINFGVYALLFGVLCWAFHWNVGVIALFSVSAFCCRNISFDIPLSLRRGLKWDYVSTAKPPKSILDRIEIRVFGYNGKAPIVVYSAVWILCLIIKAIYGE